jgi:hypothetical protein
LNLFLDDDLVWRNQRLHLFASLVLAALAVMLGSASLHAQAICRPVRGLIEAGEQNPPTCGGDFCSIGMFRGGIQGEYVVATTLNLEQPVADVIFYTGDTTTTARIGNRQGALTIKNTGVFRLSGELTELETITGGTGELAGASGVLFVYGASGETSGLFTYEGTVCLR